MQSPNQSPRVRKRKPDESLDLSDLENNEQQHVQKFIRTAKKKGTQIAINRLYGGLNNNSKPLFEEIKQKNEFLSNKKMDRKDLENSEKAALMLLKKAQKDEDDIFSQATESESESEFSEDLDYDQRKVRREKKLHKSMRNLDDLHQEYQIKKKTKILNSKDGSLQAFHKRMNRMKKRRFLINPDSWFKKFWDNTLLVFIFYIMAFSPFKISFIDDSSFPKWTQVDYFLDIVFVLDIIFTFFTPYLKNQRWVKSHKKIALRYFKAWFWLDVLSIFPLDLILKRDTKAAEFVVRITKMPKIYRMFRLLKFIRVIKLRQKKNTYIAKSLKKFIKSDNLISGILPLYGFGILISYLFSCLWHFVPKENPDAESWLIRYDFLDEPTHDRFWASVYYIYSTMTTTGYGDITPQTKQEFALTVMFVAFGVTFHSLIYTTILKKIEEFREKNLKYNLKLKYMHEMKNQLKLLSGKDGKKIYKEMLVFLEEAQLQHLDQEKKPDLSNLSKECRIKLTLEVCERVYRFDKLQFFKVLPRTIWLAFHKRMEKRIYNVGDLIYQQGDKPTHFYVLKSGQVWFMQNQDGIGTYPFVEVDSYFGEIELLEGSSKMLWTVTAKTPVVIYAIAKNEFYGICNDFDEFRDAIHKQMIRRLKMFKKSDRECGRIIRKVNRINKKINKVKESAMKKAVQAIMRSKEVKPDGEWHQAFLKIRKDKLSKNLEQGRIKRKEKALGRLERFHMQFMKKSDEGGTNKPSLSKRRRQAINIDIFNSPIFNQTECSPMKKRRGSSDESDHGWNLRVDNERSDEILSANDTKAPKKRKKFKKKGESKSRIASRRDQDHDKNDFEDDEMSNSLFD